MKPPSNVPVTVSGIEGWTHDLNRRIDSIPLQHLWSITHLRPAALHGTALRTAATRHCAIVYYNIIEASSILQYFIMKSEGFLHPRARALDGLKVSIILSSKPRSD